MTRLIYILFTILSLNSFGQAIEISGKAFSHPAPYYDKYDTLLIEKVEVKLKFKDSIELFTTTDQNGRYIFKLNNIPRQATISIMTTKSSGEKFKYMCGFMSSRDSYTIEPKTKVAFLFDFYCPPVNCCPYFADFLYDKDQVKPRGAFDATVISADSALNMLYRILENKFFYTVQLIGHADSKETKPSQLSVNRANYILNQLVSRGIDKKRLSVKGYGTSQPIKENTFGAYGGYPTITFKPGELNRRVGIRVMSSDFGVKRPAYLDKEEGEE